LYHFVVVENHYLGGYRKIAYRFIAENLGGRFSWLLGECKFVNNRDAFQYVT
jgi:hypothetical protein